jgi:uncharacterized protein YndB with AHSA1/START domain
MSSPVNTVPDITKTLELEASLERVWEAIADPVQLSAWFPNKVEIASMTPGSRGWLIWENHGRYRFEVEEVRAPDHLVWRWANDPEKELEDTLTTRVVWRLAPRVPGGTRLELIESGFETEEYRSGNDEGWDKELGELVELLAQP